jgi:hypothetical protein
MEPEVEIVSIPVSAENRDRVIQAIRVARSGYLSTPACESVALLGNSDVGEVVAVIRWTSAKDHEAALRRSDCASFFRSVAALASAAPDATRFSLLWQTSE